MNAFAEMLFSSLLGWLRGLTQGLWKLFSNGSAGGFLTWLGSHWLILIVILCAVGTLIDFLVWLRRWRPDIRWKRKAHLFMDRLKGREMRADETWRFNHGYADSIEMLKEVMEETETNEAENEDQPEQRFAAFQEEAFSYPEPAANSGAESSAHRRRRRADRYDTRSKGGLFRKVNAMIQSSSDDQDFIDGLPTVIDKNQAFHNPVYPKQKA